MFASQKIQRARDFRILLSQLKRLRTLGQAVGSFKRILLRDILQSLNQLLSPPSWFSARLIRKPPAKAVFVSDDLLLWPVKQDPHYSQASTIFCTTLLVFRCGMESSEEKEAPLPPTQTLSLKNCSQNPHVQK